MAPIEIDAGLRGEVVSRLLTAMFRGTLKEGDRLVIQKLATEFGVSVTPVREALFELYHLGMVDMLPNRGAVCRRFARADLREIYQIRGILEMEAVRKACPRLHMNELKIMRLEMVGLLETEETESWWETAYQLDCRLHGMIFDACQSLRLEFELQRSMTLRNGIYRASGIKYDTRHLQVTEHIEILDGLIDRDVERATERMGHHIHRTCEGIESVLFDSQERADVDQDPTAHI